MSTDISTNTAAGPAQVDVRGPRFAAWVTTAVLVAVLVVSAISTSAAAITLALQAVVFAIGALRGPRQHPYGLIFAKLVAPRLSPVTEREPVPPLKFAQLVGFVFGFPGLESTPDGPRPKRHLAPRISPSRLPRLGQMPPLP